MTLSERQVGKRMFCTRRRIALNFIGSAFLVLVWWTSCDTNPVIFPTAESNDPRILDRMLRKIQMTYEVKTGFESLRATESFTVTPGLLEVIGFPLNLSGVKPVTKDTFDDFVFVTASSLKRFHDAMAAIASVQKHFPRHKIFFYDLETMPTFEKFDKLNQLCNVVFREFSHFDYPEHVEKLENNAYKPLVIYDLLHEYKTVIWVDVHVRFRTSNLDAVRQQLLSGSSNIMLFDGSGHSIFAATHPDMYKYLPMNNQSAVLVDMRGSPIYIHCTQELHDAVIRWWVLCALDPKCIAPTTNTNCKFQGNDRRKQYADCHRFEQSALNILAANHLRLDASKFHAKFNDGGPANSNSSQNAELLHVCYANGTVDNLNSQNHFLGSL